MDVPIPIGWLLGVIGGLAGVIATLAGIIWHSLNSRLAAQDKIIEHLRSDIERLSKGCGHRECLWRERCVGFIALPEARDY